MPTQYSKPPTQRLNIKVPNARDAILVHTIIFILLPSVHFFGPYNRESVPNTNQYCSLKQKPSYKDLSSIMASYTANEKVHKNPFLLIPSDMDMNPVRLILEDLVSVLRLDKLLIYIVTPHSPCPSGPLDELYPNYPNLRDITLHAILVAFQSLLLLASVVFLFTFWFLPGIFPGGLVLIAWVVTVAILRLLNGQPSADCQVGVPDNGISPVNDESELWFFINGICTG